MSRIRKNALWCVLAGAVAIALAVWGTWQGVHYTSTTEFCLSCHSMRTAGEGYKTSVHLRNAPGVRAGCKDCHIPPGAVPTLIHKTETLNDLYHTFISPSIDTPEKPAAKHPRLTQREWVRMSANSSAVCKSYHSYEAMDHDKQPANAVAQMTAATAKDSSCVDCRKGIVHHKPDMSSGFHDRYRQLRRQGDTPTDATTQFSLSEKSLTATAGSPVGEALLFPAAGVKVLKKEGSNVQLEITGWRESKGCGRVITQYMGKCVFSAVLDEPLMANVKVLHTQVDPSSHQEQQRVSTTAQTTGQDFISALTPIWEYLDQILQSTYSACHDTPPTARYTANSWIAEPKAISTYYRLNPVEERILLKYLRTHASDVSGTNKE